MLLQGLAVVHAIADGLGSRRFVRSKWWRGMHTAGVKLTVALPIKWVVDTILFSRIDLRNHRKIAVIDSHIAHCGSQNCADPEFRVKAKFAPWIDIMLRDDKLTRAIFDRQQDYVGQSDSL